MEIPNFENIASFSSWVEKLEDKEIQSWSTKDWNNMFEKLNQAILKDPDLRKKDIEDIKENHINNKDNKEDYLYYYENSEKPEINNLRLSRRRSLYLQNFQTQHLEKLYRNYRLEKEDYDKLITHGQEIGIKLAVLEDPTNQSETNYPLVDNASINVMARQDNRHKQTIGEIVDKVVYDTTSYSKYNYHTSTGEPRKKYDEVKTEISVDHLSASCLGKNRYKDDNSTQTIINPNNTDSTLATAIHEAIHAHAQIRTQYQVKEHEEDFFIPRENMPEDFYTLIKNNRDFYCTGDYHTKSSTQKIQDFHASYAKQPIEKHAQLVAVTAERTFRHLREQYSERSANRLSLCISAFPETAFYNPNTAQIVLCYNNQTLAQYGTNADNLKEEYFKDLNPETKDKIRVSQSEIHTYIDVPRGYKASTDIKKFYDQQIKQKHQKEKKEKSSTQTLAMQQKSLNQNTL